MYSDPIGYFLTFTVHGTWLHGDARGSFRKGGVFVPPSSNHVQSAASSYRLSPEQRVVIKEAFVTLCQQRGWELHTANVRTNHVHVVVTATNLKPEPVMASLKAKATRELRKTGLFPTDQTLWTERGSTIYLFTQTSFDNACRYVHEGQATAVES